MMILKENEIVPIKLNGKTKFARIIEIENDKLKYAVINTQIPVLETQLERFIKLLNIKGDING